MPTFKKSLNPSQMTLGEVAEAIGRRPYTVRMYRSNPSSHPFFRKSFKTGTGPNSPLRWWRVDVDEYLRETSDRGLPAPDLDGLQTMSHKPANVPVRNQQKGTRMARTFTLNEGYDDERDIQAHSFREDGSFVTFYDAGQEQVLAIPTARISTIERTQDYPHAR